MEPGYFYALVVFAFVAGITPGPNNIMIMASGLNFGVRASLPHFFGICFGFPTMLSAVGFGIGYLFDVYPRLHELIRLIGISYLLYLAWLIAQAAPSEERAAGGKPLSFFQAALFQWVNPKAWIMGTGALATFTQAGGAIHQQVVIIVAVFFLFTFPCAGTWLFLGRILQRLLTNPAQQRWFNRAMAVLLVISIWPIGVEMWQQYTA